MRRWTIGLGLLALVLAACAPRLVTPQPPKAELTGVELVRVDPFADVLELRLDLALKNPNAFDLPLLDSELTVKLGALEARARLPRMTLPAGGEAPASIRVTLPLSRAPDTARRLINGEALPLTITARVRVEAMGMRFWLGPYVLLRDRVQLSFRLTPPRIALQGVELNLSGGELALTLVLRVDNDLPVGFLLAGAGQVELAGEPLGTLPLELRLPPRGSELSRLTLRVPLYRIPGIVARARSGAPLALRGRITLALPGVLSRSFALELTGRLP